MSLSEEAIRIIVREELSAFLNNVGRKVNVPPRMEAEKMEDAMVTIIETVSKEEAGVEIARHEDLSHDS